MEGDTAEAWFSPKFVFADPLQFGAAPPMCPVHNVVMKPPKDIP